MDNEIEFITFILGYDLLHSYMEKCKNKNYYETYTTIKNIAKEFMTSREAHDFKATLKEQLDNYINNNKISIKNELFKHLDYDIFSDYN